jgi:RHS repeat-associated protein
MKNERLSSISYSPSGNILNKTQNAETLINGNAIDVSYRNHDMNISNLPHAPTQVGDWSFDWDLNGNMLRKSGEFLIRTHCWDEENRLTAVHDAGENEFGSLAHLSAYLYDAGGERVWKLTGRVGDMKLSGKTMYSSVFFDKTLYASPYMVVTDQEYTKHYYIEGERVCTKTCAERSRSIGGGFWGTAPMMPNDNALQFMQGDEDGVLKGSNIRDWSTENIQCAEYYGQWDINPVFAHLGNKANMAEYNQYFYHSDHLGSASFITDATGYVDQHIQYLPFGELFISQRNSTFDSRYKFTAKELDNETNYTYFGARYYDSDISIWLSVDPLAAKYPHQSNYMYCSGNPVMRIDPDGMDEWEVNKKTGEVKWIKESEKHQLYVVNNKGKRTGNFVEVKNRDVLDQLTTKDASGNSVSKDHTTGSIDDVFKVFKFCSDNTSVEWGLARYNENKYAVYTSHSSDGINFPANIGLGRINAFVHSHPGGPMKNDDLAWYEKMTMGEITRPDSKERSIVNPSDWSQKRNGSHPYQFYAYFPFSSNLYHIRGSGTYNIKTVSSYRSFYFGTLNHR